MAYAIKDWLPKVIPTVRVFLSSEDIDKGSRWFSDIGTQLETSDFGILCLTPDNVDAPWILFEAGALSKKSHEARVCPFLLGLSPDHLQEPLRYFNATTTERNDVFQLVRSINAINRQKQITEKALIKLFDLHWAAFEELINEIRLLVPDPDQFSPCPVRARGALPLMHQWEPAIRANDILIIGQNLNLVLRQPQFFMSHLDKGAHLRLLIVNPREDKLIEILSRGVVEKQYTRRDFGPALDTIHELYNSLKVDEKSHLEVKIIDYVPTLSFQVLDGESPKGTILVELTPNRIAVPNRPHFILRADNAAHREWYKHFLSNCKVMFKEAVPWVW
ncbi:toll/interleukin-1 receptor domain-containing protein [Candidatus Bathyarchaeota archaeon]|nr:toll/interleukin-1 receptor domain-containing protein [Candidatus Bathyarchaeota archaeon]